MAKLFYGNVKLQDQSSLQLSDSDNTNNVSLRAASNVTGDYTLTLPAALGSDGQGMKIDGSGNLSFADFLENSLTDGNILVGNASNIATGVAMSGDVAITNAGVTSIQAGVIVDADINASAAIAFSKMENLTIDRALVSDGSGDVSISAVTATELGYVSGVTSAIQTQIDNLTSTINNFEWQPSALDYIVDNTAVPPTEVSGDRYVLSHDGGAPNAAWDGASAGDIVEFNGTSWIATTPTAGTFIAVDDDSSGLYLWGGSSYSFKNFEATTASNGLTKVGFDVQLHSSAAGDGLGFSAGVLAVNVDDSTIETNTDSLRLKDGGITNAKINATAAIAFSKMEALTANRALSTDASGFMVASAVTDTELGYLDGVTSAIQTQIDNKAGTALDNLTVASLAAEDILVASSGSAVGRLAVGTNGQVLKVVGGAVTWSDDSGSNTFKADWVTGDGTSKVVNHALGTSDVMVQIYDKANGETIEIDTVDRTDTNNVTVTASSAPGASGWRVLIIEI